MQGFACLAFLFGIILPLVSAHSSPIPANPIPELKPEPEMEIPEDYEDVMMHDVSQRDHGCETFPDDIEQPHHCATIWLKNKFSKAKIAPGAVFTDFQYASDNTWRPAVSWVEYVGAKYVRACVAAPGGMKNVLSKGKLRWLALYNQTVSNAEQFGSIEFKPTSANLIAGKYCFPVVFPTAFPTVPTLKFTLKLKYGMKTAQDSLVIWLKGVTATSAIVCLEEFYAWSRYHTQYDLYWYGISAPIVEDNYSNHGKVTFLVNDIFPANHNDMNTYFCQNVTLAHAYYPCPTVLVQPEEPSMEICETPMVAWVSCMKGNVMTVCYGDKRGIHNQRAAAVNIHYIIYGYKAPCSDLTCPFDRPCFHPTWNTAQCGCVTSCPVGGDKVCGTNMVTYPNMCELEKAACLAHNKFSYAHKGECEKFTLDHGREQLQAQPGCSGLYCKTISTRNNIWYPHADINVQVSVNWNTNINAQNLNLDHDASTSWVEDVTPNSFKACVMEAGRRALVTPPSINWFAYQGMVEEVMTKKIEVGDWSSGTHCVPLHERKPIEKSNLFNPLSCPKVKLEDAGKVDQDKWQYDAHLMAQIYGQTQYEWFTRMLMGYGVKRMTLTNGMEMDGATIMITVEQSSRDAVVSTKDAVNAWMEFDNTTREAYICLRELSNWDGSHKDIKVHWTLFNESFIHGLGWSHHMKFKPHYMSSSMYSNNAECQTQKYLPDNMDLINSATVLVSLQHLIPSKSEIDSMKKYKLHQMEIMQGSPIGDFDFMKKDVQESWTMPHMWRANLTGWRPHMRIEKNTDYSVWVEGMNGTHVKVCQKSLFNGFHFEGVMVSIFVMPDRCQAGSRLFKDNLCGEYRPNCASHAQAGGSCAGTGARLGVANDCRENVWLSYLTGQNTIHIAKNDMTTEGNWVRDFGNTNPYSYSRWGVNQPSAASIDHDCAQQGGRVSDFSESDVTCATCLPYVCVRDAPFLSCDFTKPSYCHDCGKCNKIQPFQFTCNCIPPYSGTRCLQKIPH